MKNTTVVGCVLLVSFACRPRLDSLAPAPVRIGSFGNYTWPLWVKLGTSLGAASLLVRDAATSSNEASVRTLWQIREARQVEWLECQEGSVVTETQADRHEDGQD